MKDLLSKGFISANLTLIKLCPCSQPVTGRIEELPTVSVSDDSDIGAAAFERRTAVTHLCSVGEGDGKPASAYCKDCGKLMCREHEEVK